MRIDTLVLLYLKNGKNMKNKQRSSGPLIHKLVYSEFRFFLLKQNKMPEMKENGHKMVKNIQNYIKSLLLFHIK